MQDALAVLVASEMKKVLKKDMLPWAPPKLVELRPEDPTDELDKLQVCNLNYFFLTVCLSFLPSPCA